MALPARVLYLQHRPVHLEARDHAINQLQAECRITATGEQVHASKREAGPVFNPAPDQPYVPAATRAKKLSERLNAIECAGRRSRVHPDATRLDLQQVALRIVVPRAAIR